MNTKFIVRLSDEERAICQEVVKKLKGSSEKVRRAQILLKADADGPSWTDSRIAEAFNCRVQTIENLRKRLVTQGFEAALERKKRQEPATPPKLDGAGEAKLIAMRLGKPPVGYGHWTLQLLADELVALEVVDSISPETVRKVLKKMA
jgi:Homeodomain-like domain